MIDLETYRQRIASSSGLMQTLFNNYKRRQTRIWTNKSKEGTTRSKKRKMKRKRMSNMCNANIDESIYTGHLSTSTRTCQCLGFSVSNVRHILSIILFWILSAQVIYTLLVVSGIESNPGPSFGEEFINKTVLVYGHCHQATIATTPHRVYGCACVQNSYSHGVQCVCNSVGAVAMRQLKPMRTWQSDDLNVILCSGDQLYRTISSVPRYLEMTDIPDKVHLLQEEFHVIQYASTATATQAAVIHPVLERFMSQGYSDAILFIGNRTGAYASSIHCVDSRWYIFDPHARSEKSGYPHPDGKSIVLQFQDTISCALYLKNLGHHLQAEQLNLCPVQLKLVSVSPSGTQPTISHSSSPQHPLCQIPSDKDIMQGQKDDSTANKCISCFRVFKGSYTKTKHERLCVTRRLPRVQREIDRITEQISHKDEYMRKLHIAIHKQRKYRDSGKCDNVHNVDTHLMNLESQVKDTTHCLSRLNEQLQTFQEEKQTLVVHIQSDHHVSLAKEPRKRKSKKQSSHLKKKASHSSLQSSSSLTNLSIGDDDREKSVSPHQMELETIATSSQETMVQQQKPGCVKQIRLNPDNVQNEYHRQTTEHCDLVQLENSQQHEPTRTKRNRSTSHCRENNRRAQQKRRAENSTRICERIKENLRNNSPKHKERRRLSQCTRREDKTYRQDELAKQRQKYSSLSSSRDLHEKCETFFSNTSEGPVYVCASCLQTNFRSHMCDVRTLHPGQNENLLKKCISAHITLSGTEWVVISCVTPTFQIRDIEICDEHISFDNNVWLCNPCKRSIYTGDIPKMSTANKVGFPPQPDVLKLHPLEETLIAPLIAFMTVRALPVCGASQHGQKMIVGNVVHVPNDIASTVKKLPRSLGDIGTIAIALKRKMMYKNAVFRENIRPQHVIDALTYLTQVSSMYENIQISVSDWIADMTASTHPNQAFIENEVLGNELSEIITSSKDQLQETPHNEQHHESDGDISDSDNGECPVSASGNMDTLLSEKFDLSGSKRKSQKQAVDDIQLDHGSILNIAPGEGKRPVYREPLSEYLCFPTIFCGVKRPDNSVRPRHVYTSQVFRAELCHRESRVWQSSANIFWKAKHLMEQTLASKSNFLLRRVIGGRKYTAGQLQEEETQRSIERLNEGYKFLRSMRGSPAYFEDKKKKVMAMVRQLGMPTIFFSLSAADTSWPALLRTLGVLVDKCTYDDEYIASQMSFDDKCRLISAHPIACSRYFNERVQQFVKHILTSEHSPFGQADDYMYRVEFQQRGSPHIHGLLWISNAPNIDTSSHQDICKYIDKCISCSVDVSVDELPFVRLQMHRHSRSCMRIIAGKKMCRFGMPAFPMRRTCILDPCGPDSDISESIHDELCAIREKMKQIPEEVQTFDQWLKFINKTESEYVLLVRSTLQRPKIFLQRGPRETRVNPYMRQLLTVWRANHDVQFVLDTYQCVTYVCDYMTKSQRGMSDLMDQTVKECLQGNMALRDTVSYISHKFLNAVEMPIQECAYYMLGMHIVSSSRMAEFICTSPPEKRVALMKSLGDLEELPASSKDVTYKSNIDRYTMRPNALSSWCLADYVAWIDVIYPPKQSQQRHKTARNPLYDEDTEEYMTLSDEESDSIFPYTMRNGITLRKRLRPKVIRFVSYREKVDPEEYFRERLLLYVPWKREDDLKCGKQTYEEAYMEKKESIVQKMFEYEPKASALQNAQDEYEEGVRQNSCQSVVCGETPPDVPIDTADYDIREAIGLRNIHAEPDIELVPHMMHDDEFFRLLSSLNKKQQEFFNHVMHTASQGSMQLTCALHGGAGTGKSHVIRAVYQGLHRVLNRLPGDDYTSQHVILLAPTGKAAYNIHGTTIHHALHILPNQKMSFKPLPWETLNTLRNRLGNVKWVLIDEFSMVGNRMLKLIHFRLQEIKANQKPFGGVNIICIGDLYQLKPVRQGHIFVQIPDDYDVLGPNLWTDYFTIYELDEIMRQREDKTFAEMLNRLRVGKHTHSDIEMLKTRLISQEQSDELSHFPHFFPTKNRRDAYNQFIMSKSDSFEITVTAIDAAPSDQSDIVQKQIVDAAKNKMDVSSTGNLPYKLTLKVGQQYDITANIAVEDGLINGTECVIQRVDIPTGSSFPKCVWLTFTDKKIGQQMRRSAHPKYQQLTSQGWTALEAIQRRFVVKRSHTVTRQQFPLRIAAGRTIHVSQSATYDNIVIDMHSDTRPPSDFWEHMHYVAFSRCTSLQGLHIVSLNEEQIKVSPKVSAYLSTQKRELQLCYVPSYSQDNVLKIIYNNVCSVARKLDAVHHNWHVSQSDVIILCETWLLPSQQLVRSDLNTHTLFRMDSSFVPGRRGMLIWIRTDLHVQFVDFHQTSWIEIGQLCIALPMTFLNVVAIYKPPATNLQQLKSSLIETLSKCNLDNPTIVIGDFNVDTSQLSCHAFVKFMESTFNMTQLIQEPTTYDGTCIDLVFANFNDLTAFPLVNGWSAHHLLTTYVPMNLSSVLPH